MTERSVAQKARVKPGTRVAVLSGVPGIVDSLGLPPETLFVEPQHAELVFLFVNDRAQLDERFAPAVDALVPGATIWVFYRKGSGAAGLDMSRDTVRAVAEGLGLRALGLISVDETWSAFRLRSAR